MQPSTITKNRMRQFLINFKSHSRMAITSLALSACSFASTAGDSVNNCIRPTINGCMVSMHEIIPNPKKYIGEKLTFVAFYAPSNNRPSFFMSEESWMIGDVPSAIVVSSITEDLYLTEKSNRFSYVRVSGVIGVGKDNSIEPHITIKDVEIRPMLKLENMEAVKDALKSEASIGFTEEEYSRLGIEGGRK